MDTTVNILHVTADQADARILSALFADSGRQATVDLDVASDAARFYEILYSDQQYHFVVIDDRIEWEDWASLFDRLIGFGSEAMKIAMYSAERGITHEQALIPGLSMAYPRSNRGLLALVELVGTMADKCLANRVEQTAEAAHPLALSSEDDQQSLIYAVSHDLQEPIQLVSRYAQILNDDFGRVLDDHGAEILEHLQQNIGRTQEMLDEMLDYSRLQTRKLEVGPIDLGQIVDEIVSLYQLTLDEIGGEVMHDQLPTLTVDQRQFRRLFQNLIGNAIKFRRDDPLRVEIRAKEVDNEWRISVKDNGIGIKPEDADRIFRMFERVYGREDYPGNGMGLAVCDRIVRNHGGRIWAKSLPENGSVIVISLPKQ